MTKKHEDKFLLAGVGEWNAREITVDKRRYFRAVT